MTPIQQQKAAKEFAEFWRGKGNEKSDAQAFWFSLLRQVYGMENPEKDVEVVINSQTIESLRRISKQNAMPMNCHAVNIHVGL